MYCPFCGIEKTEPQRIIKMSARSLIVLSNPRLMPGHMLVIPRRHVEKPSELSKEEREDLFDATIHMQEKVLKKLAPGCDISQHYRPFIPDGKFKVSHLHIHIRPRALDDELYTKVQIHEKDVFTDLTAKEAARFKGLFSD